MFLRYIDNLVPILTIAEHKKINNRESTLFAVKPINKDRDDSKRISESNNASSHVDGVFLPADLKASDFDSDILSSQ
jgi:hypothetical protein